MTIDITSFFPNDVHGVMLISSSYEQDAEEIIDYLLAERNQEGGWEVTTLSEIAFHELEALLVSELKRGEVMKVLGIMADQHFEGLEGFSQALSKFESNKNAGPPKEWTFCIPFQIRLTDDLASTPELRVYGRDFLIERKAKVAHHLGVDEVTKGLIRKAARKYNVEVKVPETYLVIRSEGIDHLEAWNKVSPAFDTMKGFMEYLVNIGSWRIGGISPRAKIPHPQYLLARADDERDPIGVRFIVDGHEVKESFELTDTSYRKLKERFSRLQEVPSKGSTLGVLADALRLYSQAMDEQRPHGCFLGLWQVIEAVALSQDRNVRGDTEKVRKRIAWHGKRMKLKGSGFDGLLRKFAEKRNDMVHRGIQVTRDDEINSIKLIAEVAIDWLEDSCEELPTVHHLRNFYRYRTQNEVVTDSVIESIDHIRSNSGVRY